MIRPALLVLMSMPMLAGAAHADRLAEVRATLSRAGDEETLRARIEQTVILERNDDAPERGATAFTAELGADGLIVRYPEAEMRKAEAESSSPDDGRPVTRALESIQPTEIASLLDFAPALLRTLDGARLTRESRTLWQGKQAHLLELVLDVKLSGREARHVRETQATMKLWLDASGNPIAAETRSTIKGRFFLVGFELTENATRELVWHGNRLLVTREDARRSGSGLGESSATRTTTRVIPFR
ncbi:MAG TPA: hypothetical protein VM534_03250 [Thermoanaerobaculia bacterium]|nr:hypothetical protein [Thermoanaerobaculia bacterium]